MRRYRVRLSPGKNLVLQRAVWPCTYPALHSILPLNLPRSWLQVFCRAEASLVRPGGEQALHTSTVRSEKYVRLRGSAYVRRRVIAVFFRPCAPDLLTWRISVVSHNFKRLERFEKLATSSRSPIFWKTPVLFADMGGDVGQSVLLVRAITRDPERPHERSPAWYTCCSARSCC